jgi:hypothetical protein
MPTGRPTADSASLVTQMVNGQNLIAFATALYGTAPVLWGRYFKSAAHAGSAEYRHAIENQPLHDAGIRVLPIAQQTDRVGGTQDDGAADARDNAEDLILTFGKDYLAAQGGQFLMVLDVEQTLSLTEDYYRGWASTLIAHSQAFSQGMVTLKPAVYGSRGDTTTWQALANVLAGGATLCNGIWVARYYSDRPACYPPPEFDPGFVMPTVALPCPVLLWQYSENCPTQSGIDCGQTNPAIDPDALLLPFCVPPPGPALVG